jgi:hypothetical protein
MSTKLYVGNLSFNTSAQDLETMFGEAGTVQSANLIEDRETGPLTRFSVLSKCRARRKRRQRSQLLTAKRSMAAI